MSEPAHLRGLNPQQRLAVEHGEGPLLILAGAGSGKTRVLTRRVAHLLHLGVPARGILAVTFTNKAATEMRERVTALAGERGRGVLVSTFHSACLRILRQEAGHIGYPRDFAIYDADDQLRLIKAILQDLGIDSKHHPARTFRAGIDRAKTRMLGPDRLGEGGPELAIPRLLQVYTAYAERLVSAAAMDFNDILNRLVQLFRERPDRLARWQDRFRHLLVDEYQDTNRAQYLLVRALAARHRNIAAVGDDDQSIYGFRGADVQNILDFERDFPEALVVRLEQNYRSTGRILAAASAVVRHNVRRKEKTLWTEAGQGDPIEIVAAATEEQEARLVTGRIQAMLGRGRRPGDFAILYRTNAASRAFEQALQRAELPFVLVGARRFYERREVRDAIAWLRLILNPADDMSLLRILNVPRRGLGPRAHREVRSAAARNGVPLLAAARELASAGGGLQARRLRAFTSLVDRLGQAALHTDPGRLVHLVVEETGYGDRLRAEDTGEARARLQNLEELARAASEDDSEAGSPPERLRAFLDRVTLSSPVDEAPDLGGAITLMTVHLAKGLEFPVVFVAGLVEGGFPHQRSSEREQDVEEERRLAYVAFTRAQERLVLSWSRTRRRWGADPRRAQPSRFLREIPAELLRDGRLRPPARVPQEHLQRTAELLAQLRAGPRRQPPGEPAPVIEPTDPSAFQPGQRVRHPRFGEGEIRRVGGSPDNPRLVIHFLRHGRKTILPRYAAIEILT